MAKKKKRIIFHVDMDHFFAAIEERERPEIKGKPVVVGADPKQGKGRGVVSTSNYEARNYGITSGVPITRAWSLCPDAIFLPVNYSLYRKVSARIMKILQTYADKFEGWGLDEAFLDVTTNVNNFDDAEQLALKIKNEVIQKERLTCSIGVGPNKLVAKIASDFVKPDGLTIVQPEDAESFLSPLRVRKLLWVGKKTEIRLNNMGIKTIGDLAKYNPNILAEKFGSSGTQLYLMAQGIDESDVQEHWEQKSMSRETTFQQDMSDFDIVLDIVNALSEDLHQELVASDFLFKTVTIKIRYENFETHTHGKTLTIFSDQLKDIQKTAVDLVKDYLFLDRKVRLIGVRLSNLFSAEKQTRLTDH
ncbi:MAG: DNA polymerase IV [Candidatus Bathyarchaeota archaeon]|nr:DNA polymerase IV [Candidatus Bathyarchaeum tardum]